MVEVGEKAPAFSGKDQDGNTVALKDFSGQKLAIYFYPKDNTPGCTKQACNLRDNWSSLKKHGVAIVGVSADSVKSHDKFASKYDLPFPLISDPEKKMLSRYGAWGEKNMYGIKRIGIKRTTFLVDESGEVVHVIKRPKTADHAAEILKKFGLSD
ncbi:MAG: thioredoxin-dependent thiol peroxidase [Rhodothermales bacterium]|nr:thioredoxin-dependent thiol peroxidase [Rhodothermales bacterium]